MAVGTGSPVPVSSGKVEAVCYAEKEGGGHAPWSPWGMGAQWSKTRSAAGALVK